MRISDWSSDVCSSDLAPRFVDGDAAFLLMVGFFALAQVAYAVAFRPYADQSVLAINRIALAPYAVAVVLLVAICAPGAGGMLVPVLVYGALLGPMAVLATGLGRPIWVGRALGSEERRGGTGGV